MGQAFLFLRDRVDLADPRPAGRFPEEQSRSSRPNCFTEKSAYQSLRSMKDCVSSTLSRLDRGGKGDIMADPEPTLTLPDIATLAGVQRAVVSMWRRRPRVRGQLMPFPDPVQPAGPVERFRRDEIVVWLSRTGRGNNSEHRLDAPALSAPAGAALDDLVTLLCLYTHSDGDSELADLTSAQREYLARRIDPADNFLLTEVRHLPVNDEALRFVDDLVGASLGLADALSRLERGAAGRALGRRDLTP